MQVAPSPIRRRGFRLSCVRFLCPIANVISMRGVDTEYSRSIDRFPLLPATCLVNLRQHCGQNHDISRNKKVTFGNAAMLQKRL